MADGRWLGRGGGAGLLVALVGGFWLRGSPRMNEREIASVYFRDFQTASVPARERDDLICRSGHD